MKILELPERAQELIGEDVIHLAAVDQLREIGNVAPELLDAVIADLDDGNAWAAERLTPWDPALLEGRDLGLVEDVGRSTRSADTDTTVRWLTEKLPSGWARADPAALSSRRSAASAEKALRRRGLI